jgi:hypothetical protein
MSASFHPTEEGNFAPLKERADSLFTAAKQWQASAIPAEYKTKETKTALKQLVKVCKDIKKAVTANAGDEELKKKITGAHDVFHTIVKDCKKKKRRINAMSDFFKAVLFKESIFVNSTVS